MGPHMRIPIILLTLTFMVSLGCKEPENDEPKTNAAGGAGKNPAQPVMQTNEAIPERQQRSVPTQPSNRQSVTKDEKVPDELEEITLAFKDQQARVKFHLPKGWAVVQDHPKEAQLIPPKNTHQDYVRTSCRLTFGMRQCVDLCTAEQTLAGLNGSWENWSKQWTEPATRTGKPAKNKVKTSWKPVTDEKKEGFRLVSGHLLYPEEAKKKALVRDRVVTRCTQMNLGDTLSIDTECRGAFDHEKTLRQGFEAVCRSIAIKQLAAPPKTDAQKPDTKGNQPKKVPAP